MITDTHHAAQVAPVATIARQGFLMQTIPGVSDLGKGTCVLLEASDFAPELANGIHLIREDVKERGITVHLIRQARTEPVFAQSEDGFQVALIVRPSSEDSDLRRLFLEFIGLAQEGTPARALPGKAEPLPLGVLTPDLVDDLAQLRAELWASGYGLHVWRQERPAPVCRENQKRRFVVMILRKGHENRDLCTLLGTIESTRTGAAQGGNDANA